MKKIITIIIAILVSVIANAQIVRTDVMGRAEKVDFHLGDYVFGTQTRFYGDEVKSYYYCLYLDDRYEANKLWNYLINNEKEIEEKYGVIIENIKYDRVSVGMNIYTPSEYQEKQNKSEK